MANKVISIEIGNAVTRIVQMDYQTKHPKVYRHTTIPTPEGCMTDGYINNDNPALAEAIKEAIAIEKMNATKNVIFTIASSKILTREVMLPPIKANMIETTVRMNLSEYFPIDLSQHEVSNIVLEHIKEGDNAGRYRVLIIAAEKALVQSYESLAKNTGLTLIQVDYVGNSIYQCFKNEQVNRCNMILKVEETQTAITIVDHQNLLLQRNISYGIEEVIREVADRPAFGCKSYEQACNHVKDNLCIFETLAETSLDNSTENSSSGQAMLEARAAVTRSLSGFINAVSRVVDFYNSRYNVPIDRIYVCGMGGDLQGINTLLTNEMGIKTHVLKKLEELQWVATTDLVGFHCYAATIGASFNPVGLFSKAREDKEKHKTNYKAFGILVFVLAIVVCLALFIPKFFSLQSLKEENTRLTNLKSQYQNDKIIYDKYTEIVSLYSDIYAASLLIENPNDSILQFFEELEKKVPSDFLIDGFTTDEEKFTITFVVSDKLKAAKVIEMFRGFDSLADIIVTDIKETHEELSNDEVEKMLEAQGVDNAEAETVNEFNENVEGENTVPQFTVNDNEDVKYIVDQVEITLTGVYKSFTNAVVTSEESKTTNSNSVETDEEGL